MFSLNGTLKKSGPGRSGDGKRNNLLGWPWRGVSFAGLRCWFAGPLADVELTEMEIIDCNQLFYYLLLCFIITKRIFFYHRNLFHWHFIEF